jgi:hypothetical protein
MPTLSQMAEEIFLPQIFNADRDVGHVAKK